MDFVAYATRQMQLASARAQATSRPRAATLIATVGALVLVLGVATWWGMRAASHPAPAPPSPALASSPPREAPALHGREGPAVREPEVPAQPPPILTEAELQADALRRLQGLHGRVQAGTTYLDYAPAAFEANKAVSLYVSASGGDAELKSGARATMDLYMLAASAWNAALRMNGSDRQGAAAALASVSRDPALELCPPARAARDSATSGSAPSGSAPSDSAMPAEVAQGLGVVSAVPAIFECAEGRLAELERHLSARSDAAR